jgi:cytochrome c biogenesis protein CcmG/thiol:disulfide interchange protein DsbE
MKRIALFLIPLAAFVVLAVFLLRGLWLNPRSRKDKKFASADMAGQVWVFNVWASWCTPCRQEHPLWNAFARKQLVPLIGLNYKDKGDAARGWLAELGDPYQVNVVDADGRLGIDFGVYGVPETFVIDKKGVIRFKHIGPITAEVLDRKIVPLIQQLQGES